MKKIIILANDTTYTYNLRYEIIHRLIAEGNIVIVVSEILQFQDELKAMGCKLISVDAKRRGTNPINDLRLMCQYLQILKEEKPDLVLSFNIKPNVYGGIACRLLDICYMPNVTGLGTALEHPGKMQKLTSLLYKWGVGGAKYIFFQNEANQKFFEDRGMMPRNSHVCLLPGSGVNLEHHRMYEYPKNNIVHFLFAARIMKEKGIDLFLAAARKYHNENTCFDVCGSCDDEQYIEILQRAHESGIITYHGQQKDLKPFYERCSCFLYPSYYPEGMSNVLLEAAASGRPAIAADRPGCRETVDYGITGYVVPVNHKAAVLDAVENFLNLTWEQRRDMGLAARAKVEKEFNREIVVQAYMDAINAMHTRNRAY